MSDTCRLFLPFGDPWPSCLLPSQNEPQTNFLEVQKFKGNVLPIDYIFKTCSLNILNILKQNLVVYKN